ncbi:MAG TPA: hypothetical protein VN802_14615 [Stellaceae bacterium]|nr:hypothetical protein [Stellaceae bacterium]
MTAAIRQRILRFAVPAAGLGMLAAFALLYRFDAADYDCILRYVGLHPFRYPFLDLQYVLAVVDCSQRGIDVYVVTPCDVLGRPMGYSPLWLRATFLPGEAWSGPLGFAVVTAFFVSLGLLSRPRSGWEVLVTLIATLSPVTAFAVERANVDVIMFLLAMGAGILLLGPWRRRVGGYTVILFAGLLKFYPLALLILSLRERPRTFLAVNGICAAAILTFVAAVAAELSAMAPNIPHGVYFSDLFGAEILPGGIIQILASATHPATDSVETRAVNLALVATLFAMLFLQMARGLIRIVQWGQFRDALTHLPEHERMFLLVGAALVSGCFFGGQSVGYRGIHLLFALPAFILLARATEDARVRATSRAACILVVVLMWHGFFPWYGILDRAGAPWPGAVLQLVPWLVREIVWWYVATLLLAILICFAADRFGFAPRFDLSAGVADTYRWWRGQRG